MEKSNKGQQANGDRVDEHNRRRYEQMKKPQAAMVGETAVWVPSWLVGLQVAICLRDGVLTIDGLGNGDPISFRTRTDHPAGARALKTQKSRNRTRPNVIPR
jgi:hypothetical protein